MNDYYNIALATYLALQAGSLSFHKSIDGITDALMDQSGIDLTNSSNYYYDTLRTGYGSNRTHSVDIGSEEFDTLLGWTSSNTGTATTSIITVTDPDPAINGKSLKLYTGTTLGSIARVQKDIGSLPSSYGIGIMSRIGTTSIYGSDSLHIDITNVDSVELRIRERYLAYEIFQDGAWQLALAHPNHNLYMESWVEVIAIGDGTHRVQVLLGTEIIFDRVGYLPTSAGPNGQIVVWQEGTASNVRLSEVAYLHIGTTQKANNMVITSKPVTATFIPTTAKLLFLIEDVSNSIDINNNIVGEVSNDNGTTWQTVTMARRGTFAPGEIDPPKNTDIFTGEVSLTGTGTSMKWRMTTTGNNWNFLQGIHLGWE